MSTSTDQSQRSKENTLAQNKLSDMVTNIEFTMVSVVAGLMLVPLIDYAAPLVRGLRFEYWIYIFAQLAIILYFWTAMIAHSLTFIGWPIDVGHNLFYLIVFPIVGIANHFLDDLLAFYPMLILIALLGLLLTVYDLSLIRRRRINAEGAAAELYDAVYQRQVSTVFVTLVGFVITILMSSLVAAFPGFFIVKHMHLVLGIGLLAFILFIEIREIIQLNRLRDKILNKVISEAVSERGIV